MAKRSVKLDIIEEVLPRPPKRRGRRSIPPALIELHRELQADLARYGVTHFTLGLAYQLKRALLRELGISPLDAERLDGAYADLHLAAWPKASGRPPRLTAGDLTDPRE